MVVGKVLGMALLIAGGVLAVEQLPGEWTLEEARKHWKPMVRPVQHVGLPGYQFQAGVLWDGSLVYRIIGRFR
jgi:hypothetical protein